MPVNVAQITGAIRKILGRSTYLTLMHGRNSTGTVLDATGASGCFKITNTAGTLLTLNGVAAQNNTKTDIVAFEGVIPKHFKPTTIGSGSRILITVNCQHTEASGTGLTNTIQAKMYRIAPDGTSSADLIAGAATAIPAAAGNVTFTVPALALGTAGILRPGDRFLLTLTSIAIEANNAGTTTNIINSVSLS